VSRFGQRIDPQERAAGRELTLHPAFGKADVLVKPLSGLWPQFDSCRRGCCDNHQSKRQTGSPVG
jgi:hypothetical protein